MGSLSDRQVALEQRAKDDGVARARKLIEEAIRKDRAVETPAGVAILKRAVEPLADAIRATIADAASGRAGRRLSAVRFLEMLEPEVSAYLALRQTVNAAVNQHALLHAAMKIAADIEEELRLAAFENVEPSLYHHVMRKLKERGSGAGHARRVFVFTANKFGLELPTLTNVEKTHLGVKLIDLVIETLGLVEVHNVREGKRWKARLIPQPEVRGWIEDYNVKASLLHPDYAPTVVPPRDWTAPFGGGYLTDALRALPLVKRSHSKTQIEALKEADLTTVYTGLNAIQRTTWRVNTRILDLMTEAWDRNLDLAIPNREEKELPPKPLDIDTNEEAKRAWKMEAARVHEFNIKARSQRVNFAMTLAAARQVRDDPVIYFPHNLDFRGRAYAIPSKLNPQGNDWSRALLTFAEGKPVNDERAHGWLAIHGANLYGYDKAALDERIGWVAEREDLIRCTAREPFCDLWWLEADKPWTFLAWCIEYSAFLKHGYGYVSSFPVSVDGSCNGLQHFSAMLRDPIGGAAVNLVPGPVPSDIYQRVADRVIERLKAESDPALHWIARAWLAFGIDRKITKRPVMVLPYGGTFRSCMKYVRDAVGEKIDGGKENPFGDETGQATAYLAKLVWHSISDVVVAARAAMGWLQTVARIASKHKLDLRWTAPSGFPALQAYRNFKVRRVKTRMQGSLVYLSQREETDTLDRDRQAQAVSPNFVHSMDAAAMMLTIELALHNGVTQFAVVHDSYGTVAADMDMLSACLRQAFVDMYSEHNVLEEFLAGLPEEVRAECPPIPPMGTLNLKEVIDSQFFFA